MKTLVFLAGMVPFQNTNARKNVYFFKYRDNSGQRIKSELGRKFSRIQRRVRTLYALLAHRGIGRFIIFDSGASSMLLKFLAFFYPKSHRIIYVRNHIIEHTKLEALSKGKELGYELWTYNEADSLQYDLKLNPQVLDRSLFSDILGQEAIYSAVFVGSTKGRNVLISTLQEQLTALGLNTLFYVHEQNSTVTTSGNETQQKLIPYEEYVALIGKSEAIIDIVNESNYGLTVRPLEALFAKKKLITNYSEIVHYDFYHEDNIFIFDKSNIDQIPAWLEKPYHPIDEAILVRYDIDAWLDRFEHRSINE